MLTSPAKKDFMGAKREGFRLRSMAGSSHRFSRTVYFTAGGCSTLGTSFAPKKTARIRIGTSPSFRPRCHLDLACGNPCPALNTFRSPSAYSTVSVPSSTKTNPWTGWVIHSVVVRGGIVMMADEISGVGRRQINQGLAGTGGRVLETGVSIALALSDAMIVLPVRNGWVTAMDVKAAGPSARKTRRDGSLPSGDKFTLLSMQQTPLSVPLNVRFIQAHLAGFGEGRVSASNNGYPVMTDALSYPGRQRPRRPAARRRRFLLDITWLYAGKRSASGPTRAETAHVPAYRLRLAAFWRFDPGLDLMRAFGGWPHIEVEDRRRDVDRGTRIRDIHHAGEPALDGCGAQQQVGLLR